MTKILAVVLLLSPLSAFAMPSVGDDALFDLTATSAQGQSVSGTYENTYVSYDATAMQYDEKQTTVLNGGNPSSQDQQVALANAITDAQVAALIQTCAQNGGALETLTVPAGAFNTCKIVSQQDATAAAWIAEDVAFGVVQMQWTQDGITFELKLRSQKMGQ